MLSNKKTIRCFFAVFFVFYFSSKGQNKIVYKNIKKKVAAHKEAIDFKKASLFFIEKKWDSSLVYAAKQLNANFNEDLADFCYYYKGVGFQKKHLHGEALKNFKKISSNFTFYNLVKMIFGEIKLQQKEYKEAITFLKEIEKLSKNQLIGIKKSKVYHNLGLCYFHLSQFKQAESYLLKSTSLQEKENNALLLISSYMDVANLYYEQYKDDLAIPYFKKAYVLSKKTPNFELKQNAALNMAVVEENQKDFVEAMKYRKEYDVWKDSLNNQNKIWAVAEAEKKNAINQKQKEIQLLASENKVKASQRNGFIASSILLLLLFVIAIYFYKQKSKTNKVIKAQKENLDALNTTKDKLFSIVSHDLRSSVNTMQHTNAKLINDITHKNYDTLDKSAHKNAAIANSTFNLLENLLHWATLQTNQLYFHIESVDLFSVMQQIAYNYNPLFEHKNLTFINTIPKASFVLADLDSLKIIIRNLFDNAIKFSNETDTISVYTLDTKDTYLQLVIEDTGIGMSEIIRNNLLKEGNLLNKKKNQKGIGTGLGIQLCKAMIKKNKGKFTIESIEEQGTKMIISLQKWVANE